MKKLLILLFCLLISLNTYSDSLQKSDFESKTYTYSQRINNVSYTIEQQYLKNGSLKTVSNGSDGSMNILEGEDNIWWVNNNFLYVQYQGQNPIPFSFNFDTNSVSYNAASRKFNMKIVNIEEGNLLEELLNDFENF
jgi:hypothetical protein